MRYKIFLILFTLLSCNFLYADDSELIKKYNELNNKIQKDNNPLQNTIEKVYEAMLKAKPEEITGYPKTETVLDESKRIIKQFDLPDTKEMVDDPSCIDPDKLGDFRIYVFISKSVPENTLKTYMRDAYKLKDAILVMRGVVGSADFLKPTQNFISNLACGKNLDTLKKDERCDMSRVDINPLLYTLFKIDKVPSLVFTKLSYTDLMIKVNLGQEIKDDEYYIIKGDISLEYALTKFADAGANVESYLKALRGSYGGKR